MSPPFRTIVAAVDFSAGAAAALVRAADLAERSGASLHLLHADVLFRSSGDGAPDASPSSALRVRVERFAADALGPDALDALGAQISVVRDVTAPAAILRHTAHLGADVVVVGTHGRSSIKRLLLGSVAEAVVAAAPCPVLAVPERGATVVPSAQAPVLVAVDFSERSPAALNAGRALADAFGASVELVHVVRDGGPYPAFAPDLISVSDRDPDEGAAVRERLARFACSVPGFPVTTHVAYGAPSRVIPALAAERRAGAIVMGTHGRSGLARIVGSVAQATLRRATCPVLTLRHTARPERAPAPVRSALAS